LNPCKRTELQGLPLRAGGAYSGHSRYLTIQMQPVTNRHGKRGQLRSIDDGQVQLSES